MLRPTTPGESTGSARALALTSALLGTLLAVTVWAQLPSRVASPWLVSHRQTIFTLWPQRWSFFAATADTDTLTAYRVDTGDNTVTPVDTLAMSAQDTWGLGRWAQLQLAQGLDLADQIPARYWISCARPLSRDCLARTTLYRFANQARPATLCGPTAFVRTPPPAAPTPSVADTSGEVALAQITCPESP